MTTSLKHGDGSPARYQILQEKHTRPVTMPFESKVKTNKKNSGVVMRLTSDSRE